MGAFPYALCEGVGRYLHRMVFFDYKRIFSSDDRATGRVVNTDRDYEPQRAAGEAVKPAYANSADGSATAVVDVRTAVNDESQNLAQGPSPTADRVRSVAGDHDPATRILPKIAGGPYVRNVESLQTSTGTTFVSMLDAHGEVVAFDYDETVAAAWSSRRGVIALDPADATALRGLLQSD